MLSQILPVYCNAVCKISCAVNFQLNTFPNKVNVFIFALNDIECLVTKVEFKT